MSKEPVEVIKKTTTDLINLLEIKPREWQIEKSEAGFKINMTVSQQESGILVGFHGKTLRSLEYILSIMIFRQTGDWQLLNMDINDYRQERKGYLERLAQNAVKKVKFSGEQAVLPYLSAKERRHIHAFLADNQEVKTESQGEDQDRRLVVMAAE